MSTKPKFSLPLWAKNAKKALIDKDMNVTELASALNLSRSYVSHVINGKFISPGVQEAICEFLGVEAYPNEDN